MSGRPLSNFLVIEDLLSIDAIGTLLLLPAWQEENDERLLISEQCPRPPLHHVGHTSIDVFHTERKFGGPGELIPRLAGQSTGWMVDRGWGCNHIIIPGGSGVVWGQI